jgi:outer membrane lipoprotein-sorting protein
MRGNIVRTGRFLAASLVLLAAFAGAASAAGFAEPKVEYSADNYVTAEDGKEVKFKMYQAPDRQRMDFDEGGKQSMIFRPDKKVSWIVMPEQKMYLEMSLEDGKAKGPGTRTRDMSDCSVTQKPSGKEVVNGVDTTRSDVDVSCPDGAKYTGKVWMSKEGIMVKMDATAKDGSGTKGRVRMELKNLKVGKLAPGTFEVPSGYKPMKMPGMGDFKESMGSPPQKTGTQPTKVKPSKPQDTGRSYTSQPRSTGRSDTAEESQETKADQQETSKPEEKSTIDKVLDPAKKIKGLFKW